MQKLLETVTKRVYSSSQNEDSIQPDPSIQLPKMPIKDAQVLARLNTQLANPAIMDQMVCVCFLVLKCKQKIQSYSTGVPVESIRTGGQHKCEGEEFYGDFDRLRSDSPVQLVGSN